MTPPALPGHTRLLDQVRERLRTNIIQFVPLINTSTGSNASSCSTASVTRASWGGGGGGVSDRPGGQN